MRIDKVNKHFDDYSFIRLFFACMYNNDQIFFDRDNLRYDLYLFKSNDEYRELFQDISVKQEIEGNFLEIEEALQNANLYGLIELGNNVNNMKSIILLDDEHSKIIIDNCDQKYVVKMNDLVKELIDKKKEENYVRKIKY